MRRLSYRARALPCTSALYPGHDGHDGVAADVARFARTTRQAMMPSAASAISPTMTSCIIPPGLKTRPPILRNSGRPHRLIHDQPRDIGHRRHVAQLEECIPEPARLATGHGERR